MLSYNRNEERNATKWQEDHNRSGHSNKRVLKGAQMSRCQDVLIEMQQAANTAKCCGPSWIISKQT